MSKNKKEEKGLQVMDKFLDDSWVQKRQEELERELASGYDAAKDILLIIKWDGDWEIRALPILPEQRKDWLRLIGWHWNVLPSSDNEKKMPIGCPRINWGQECLICDAIDELVSKRKREFKDFGMNGNGLAVQKRALIRGLLINYEPKAWTEKAPKFDFSEGPLLRMIGIPTGTVAKELGNKLANPKFGFKGILHPVEGKIINVERNKNLQNKWGMDLLDPYPIPERFLNVAEWPEIDNFIPKTTPDEVRGYLEKYERSLDADVVNIALSTDAGISKPQLPEGPTKTEQDLKDKLKNI